MVWVIIYGWGVCLISRRVPSLASHSPLFDVIGGIVRTTIERIDDYSRVEESREEGKAFWEG
jgi:hypothetical protein